MDEIADLLDAEIARLQRLIRFATELDALPSRELHDYDVPAGAIVTQPSDRASWQLVVDNTVVDAGTTWRCGYCSWRDRCMADGPGGVQQQDFF